MIGWQAAYRAARELERRQNWQAAANIYRRLIKAGEDENPRVTFRLGNALFHLNALGDAEHFLSRAIELDPSQASWHYRLGFIHERQGRHAIAAESYTRALDIEPSNSAWKYRLYQCFKTVGNRDTALDHLRNALNEDPTNPKYHDLAASELRRSGPRWQEAQSLERGLPFHETDPAWHTRMGEAYAALSRPLEAAMSYRAANNLQTANADRLFREADQWHRAGRRDEAKRTFAAAMGCSKNEEVRRFGPGVFYQKEGDWDRAARAYEEQLKTTPLDAELLYRTGLAHDRCYRWQTAASYYLSALSIEGDKPYWHYKLGFSYERMEEWDDAAAAYEYAASSGNNNRYWWYRAGYAKLRAGEFRESCDYFRRSAPRELPSASTKKPETPANEAIGHHMSQIAARRRQMRDRANDPGSHRKMADAFAALNEWDLAAESYDRAIYTSDDHDPALYYLWGNALFHTGDYKKAALAFCQTRIFSTPDGIDVPKYLKNASQKNSMQYLEYYETTALEPDTILWESNHGSTIGCHPLAVFRHIVDTPEYKNYRHIWAINDPAAVPEDLKGRSNVFFTKTHSDLYLRMLATASYLVNNVSFPPYFMRRSEQRYLNTWHGTPFKTLGKDMRGVPMEHSNLARNFLHSTHLMSPNAHTSWALIDRHDLTGLFRGEIQVTGSPRLDRMINDGTSLRKEIRAALGIEDELPVVLYAPTWRGSTTDRVLDDEALQADIKAMTAESHHLLFRAHRLTEKLVAGLDLGAAIVPPDIDTSDLLSAVDVLITDYSSISFDFVPLKRPIIYYTYDIDDYRESRGLYLDAAEMPGDFCQSRVELPGLLRTATSEGIPAAKLADYEVAEERFAPMEDGRASERVADFFFNNNSPVSSDSDLPAQGGVQTVLFHHSLIPNGIATSFRNLVGSFDEDEIRRVLVVEPHVLNREPGRLTQYDALPPDVQLIGRVGQQSLRAEERWLKDKYTRYNSLPSAQQWDIYMHAMKREFYRIFASTNFASIVEFDGYSPFWASLLAAGGSEDAVHSIYLHNDMLNEWKMKFANLEAVFRLYPYFDRYVSVSESIGVQNASSIGTAFGLDEERFTYAHNQIDQATVETKSLEALDDDLAAWFTQASVNAVSIGRLSPEKDHSKLIRAFVAFHGDSPDSNLLIIGDGPLKNDLEHQIREARAEGYIRLAGQRLNPYPALAQASVFVLSSLHEGQPMVLFEAMVLKRRIICTDMPGPRDILQGRHGLIVENSEDGLRDGLNQLVSGTIPREEFDPQVYIKDAKEQFLSRISPAERPV